MIEYMIHIFDVSIIDSEGKLISRQQLMGSTSGLNISELDAGIYVVNVYSGGELQSTSRILKRDD
jgi:hypothetical protein